MAQSTEPTDIPLQLHTGELPPGYTEAGWLEITSLMAQMEKATRAMTSMAQELDRREKRIEHLIRCVDSKVVEIARLKHQLAILRRHP